MTVFAFSSYVPFFLSVFLGRSQSIFIAQLAYAKRKRGKRG